MDRLDTVMGSGFQNGCIRQAAAVATAAVSQPGIRRIEAFDGNRQWDRIARSSDFDQIPERIVKWREPELAANRLT